MDLTDNHVIYLKGRRTVIGKRKKIILLEDIIMIKKAYWHAKQ